jgi:hypothetical protein
MSKSKFQINPKAQNPKLIFGHSDFRFDLTFELWILKFL